MRKITFIINDLEFMKQFYKMSDENFNDVFKNEKPFEVSYTLIGEKQADRYELKDSNENKLNINDLNAYERSAILNDCYNYFNNGKCANGLKEPFGVVNIIETNI